MYVGMYGREWVWSHGDASPSMCSHSMWTPAVASSWTESRHCHRHRLTREDTLTHKSLTLTCGHWDVVIGSWDHRGHGGHGVMECIPISYAVKIGSRFPRHPSDVTSGSQRALGSCGSRGATWQLMLRLHSCAMASGFCPLRPP